MERAADARHSRRYDAGSFAVEMPWGRFRSVAVVALAVGSEGASGGVTLDSVEQPGGS